MKTTSLYLLLLLTALMLSCKDNEPALYSFRGKVQKGPFIKGTIVTLNELNENLGQTGKTFTTNIYSDAGEFELNNVELDLGLVQLTANGYYFSENYGQITTSPITLQALVDLKNQEHVNINVLTHLEKERIEYLVSQGYTFQEASDKANYELMWFFGIMGKTDVRFENLDISQNNEYNAILLAVSIVAERKTIDVNGITFVASHTADLLSKLSFDFEKDGQIGDLDAISTLNYNAYHRGNTSKIRANIENHYMNLGDSVFIPNFEKYLSIFEQNFKNKRYVDFFYPDTASNTTNILNPARTGYRDRTYILAAAVPANSTLVVEFTGYNFRVDSLINGWELESNNSNGFVVRSTVTDEVMVMQLTLIDSGEGSIDYYENNLQTPKYRKQIRWE